VRKRIALIALSVAALALASVPAIALAGKGGGGGKASITSFAISSQSPGSVTFGLSMSSAPSKDLGVTSTCYDANSQPIWSGYADVAWQAPTIGSAGPLSSRSGLKCFAYAHEEGSTRALDGGTFSYLSP
jgi:hypothetical protein